MFALGLITGAVMAWAFVVVALLQHKRDGYLTVHDWWLGSAERWADLRLIMLKERPGKPLTRENTDG